jgi:transcriptional regulator with XRE-family HTH domain
MEPVDIKELGQYIRKTRIDRDMSLRELGRVSGVDIATISRLETGDSLPASNPWKLKKIADALELDSNELFRMAGIPISEELPDLAPYLKAKYNLPEGAIDDLAEHLKLLEAEYKPNRNQAD